MPGLIEGLAREHPGKRVELWFMDEARVGQKGSLTHVWYQKGVRPRGMRQQGFASAHLFGAVCPERDAGVALVLPEVSTAAMDVFLAELARAVSAETHVALVLDGAGWHVSEELAVPANLTLIHLPPYSPELNPVERVWEHLRDRWLSHRVLAGGYEAVVDAACAAWNALLAEPGRLRSLTSFPWLPASVCPRWRQDSSRCSHIKHAALGTGRHGCARHGAGGRQAALAVSRCSARPNAAGEARSAASRPSGSRAPVAASRARPGQSSAASSRSSSARTGCGRASNGSGSGSFWNASAPVESAMGLGFAVSSLAAGGGFPGSFRGVASGSSVFRERLAAQLPQLLQASGQLASLLGLVAADRR